MSLLLYILLSDSISFFQMQRQGDAKKVETGWTTKKLQAWYVITHSGVQDHFCSNTSTSHGNCHKANVPHSHMTAPNQQASYHHSLLLGFHSADLRIGIMFFGIKLVTQICMILTNTHLTPGINAY